LVDYGLSIEIAWQNEKESCNMLKVTASFAVVAIAGSAIASPVLGDYASYNQISSDMITAISLEEGTQGAASVLYSSIDAPAGYFAFPLATGPIGFDDYTSTVAGSIAMTEFRFVGGVDTPGGVVNFEFYNAAGDTLIDAFAVTLAGAGNFIYTIDLSANGLVVDGAGVVQMVVDAGANGQFFLTGNGATVGSNDGTFGGANGGALAHSFEISGSAIPAPGALALMGLGGLVAGRRRR
jgi:MYXO-CTERM domain-containing protein